VVVEVGGGGGAPVDLGGLAGGVVGEVHEDDVEHGEAHLQQEHEQQRHVDTIVFVHTVGLRNWNEWNVSHRR
jgi:hypothetical protein